MLLTVIKFLCAGDLTPGKGYDKFFTNIVSQILINTVSYFKRLIFIQNLESKVTMCRYPGHSLIHPEAHSKILPAKKLVVLLHGVGSNGHDVIKLVSYIKDDLPDCHSIAPRGVEPYDMAACGRQWFSLQNRMPYVMKRLLGNNVAPVTAIIKQKQTALNFTNKDTIMMGLSQGAMMCLCLTLIHMESFL